MLISFSRYNCGHRRLLAFGADVSLVIYLCFMNFFQVWQQFFYNRLVKSLGTKATLQVGQVGIAIGCVLIPFITWVDQRIKKSASVEVIIMLAVVQVLRAVDCSAPFKIKLMASNACFLNYVYFDLILWQRAMLCCCCSKLSILTCEHWS